ncbi:hypothetical protein BD309DRAFT_902684 [Dichomitus squalens]|nr:hypothetical protein BD309DRAFT_902684 [Dichomitus squalens]
MPYAGPSDASSTTTATRSPHPHRRTRSSSNFSDERGPGAFAPLGQLPRLNKKAVFHINDNDDDDNPNDDDRPSYTSYASPYSPFNSLRLSMNTGKFSPSVDPPPRIDIPPLDPSTAVPFPTCSPASPSSSRPSSPFLSFSRSSSKTASPSLPRTPSSSIILSNGKPLKSSLKSSASSPNISDLPIKHMRAQSAPSTPSHIKNVHFAEKDSGLETVRVYNRAGKPASLSKPPGDETETETEAESNSFPFPVLPASHVSSSASSTTLLHEIDSNAERTSPVPKLNPSPYANVFLETLTLPKTRPPTLRGTILVRNVAFEKTVAVRFTLDDWQTTSEVMCKHVVSLPGLPPPFPRARTMGDVAANIATGQTEDDQKEGLGPAWDRFSFTIRLEDYETKLSERTLYLVVRYNPGSGGEWWDNNDGANYRVGFRRAAASPLPSPALGAAHSQQRTFSAPSTLRTTPTTGTVSPYTPSTRQLAPTAPQLVRSMSSPYPNFGRENNEWEKMSEKGLGTPTAAYLSRKLNLSNYVAPSAQASTSSMVTPPTTPPGTGRLRSASLPAEAGLSADEPKEKPAQTAGDEKTPTGPTLSPPTHRTIPEQGRPTTSVQAASSSSTYRSPSPSAGSPPVLSPLTSIPGPSADVLAANARSFGPSSFGYGFDEANNFGYSRPQLLSPPHSKEGSPSSSGTASPRRDGSPERSALGLEVVSDSPAGNNSATDKAAVASLSDAVRELGLNMSPDATANANARVDTSDPTYAALLRQWCFAQSSPPAPNAASSPSASQTKPPLRSPASILKSGETTPKVGFGVNSGYGFPGFNFGLPDAGIVGGEQIISSYHILCSSFEGTRVMVRAVGGMRGRRRSCVSSYAEWIYERRAEDPTRFPSAVAQRSLRLRLCVRCLGCMSVRHR